jgi:hypothetical protein
MKKLLKFLDPKNKKEKIMEVAFIEQKLNEIYAELEKEVMQVLMDESLNKKYTNIRMKPLKSTKQILQNALESIKMVDRLAKEELEK